MVSKNYFKFGNSIYLKCQINGQNIVIMHTHQQHNPGYTPTYTYT